MDDRINWIDDLKSPSSMTWDERRDSMLDGAFEGSEEQELAERKLIRDHFRGVKENVNTDKEGG